MSAMCVDLVKLDIEGGELAAVRGATGVIRKWHRIITFQRGSEYARNDLDQNRKALYDLLVAEGYEILSFFDFLFKKGGMGFEEFRRRGLNPFRAFKFYCLSERTKATAIITDPPKG